MIKKWIITGDCHGDFSRFDNYTSSMKKDRELGIILLGDVGFNYYGNEKDNKVKEALHKEYNFTIYCLRGNHEMRPQHLSNIKLAFDTDIYDYVYYEPNFPRIKYFKDFGSCLINGYHVGYIGGAYSVDKWYRLQNGWSWFEDEQLSTEEMTKCRHYFLKKNRGRKFDLMLTHTCPISWEPTDLFLPMIDQTKVDKTTEKFLEDIKNNINWKHWLFGHYHEDRLVRPHVEMLYKDTESLEDFFVRWRRFDKNNEIDWWLKKDPNFYMEVK